MKRDPTLILKSGENRKKSNKKDRNLLNRLEVSIILTLQHNHNRIRLIECYKKKQYRGLIIWLIISSKLDKEP